MAKKNIFALLAFILLASVMLAACGKKEEANTPEPSAPANSGTTPAASDPAPANNGQDNQPAAEQPPAPKEEVAVKQILDWFPQSTHGGHFAAAEKGIYKDAGLNVTLEPGGPQVSATQIVASGKAEFGITGGDVLLQAREEGIPIVAVAAYLQDSPAALFYHTGQDIQGFEDLNGRRVTALLYAAYWQYLKNAFNLDQVQETNFTGQYANFLEDKESVVQGYLISDVASFKAQGVDVQYLEVSSSGYRPYMSVLFTTEKYLQENPETVKAYVEATIKGWNYYKDHAPEINPVIAKANTSKTAESLDAEAAELQRYVYEGDAAQHGVGYMSAERWADIAGKLFEVGVLKKEVDVSKVFTPDFLPGQ